MARPFRLEFAEGNWGQMKINRQSLSDPNFLTTEITNVKKCNTDSEKALGVSERVYILLACLLFILIGFDLIESKYWAYMPTEGEIVGKNILVGFRIVAGSILIGAALLSLTILRKAGKA